MYHRPTGKPRLVEPLEARLVLDSTVVFNEIMYHPADSADDAVEWIELHNQMAVDMDISRWSLKGGVQFDFAEGTEVPGRGYLVVAVDPVALELATGINGVLGPFTGSLSNGGEQLLLYNNDGRVMNRVDYRDGGDWPVGPDGGGVSLAKGDEGTASDRPENWTFSSVVGGTPGAVNRLHTPGVGLSRSLVFPGSPARVLVPSQATQLNADWHQRSFEDASDPNWVDTRLGIGFDTVGSSAVGPLIAMSGDIETMMVGLNASAFTRTTFQLANPHALAALDLQLDYDDGYIVYLNGAEVARRNAPEGTPAFDAQATQSTSEDVLGFWDLAADWTTNPANNTDSSTWSYRWEDDGGNSASRDGDYALLSQGSYLDPLWDTGDPAFLPPDFWVAGPNNRPLVWKNESAGDLGSSIFYTAPPGTVVTQTDTDEMAIHSWLSPIDGTIQIQMRATNLQNSGGTRYFIEQNDSSETLLDMVLGSGVGSSTGLQTLDAVQVSVGDRINLVVDPVNQSGGDSQAIEFTLFTLGGIGHDTVDLSGHVDKLVAGTNVLAIQGMNVTSGDSDFLLRPELQTTFFPAPPVVINEVGSALDASFRMEIANLTDSSAQLEGLVVAATGAAGGKFVFGDEILPAGGLRELTEAELGFRGGDGENLFLLSPGEIQLVDARKLTNRLRGRSPQHDDQWLYPETPTPGAVNHFSFQDQIVINEIMYHHQPIQAMDLPLDPAELPLEPAELPLEPAELISFNDSWRFRESASGLPSDWAVTSHPVGLELWQAGGAPIGFETDSLPIGLQTVLADPTSMNPAIITYYFETDFTFAGDPLDPDLSLELKHLIDDGAVFYLNGVEVLRHNMPGGLIHAGIGAFPPVGNANLSESIILPKAALVVGQNRFSVEVHQQTTTASTSDDVVFGIELKAGSTTPPSPTDPPLPTGLFQESSEEWIELYNRGTSTVDLSDWSLDDAVDFHFPVGTTISPGGYLVVAKDAAALAAANPGIQIVGDFSRSLSNKTDRIVLRDAQRNPADDVQYFDNGRWPEFADGGGSSLELRDPRSDNSRAEVWAASDETNKSTWNTYTVRQIATADTGPVNQWREFHFGLLDSAQVLIDDVSVIENPSGAATELLQNGSFELDSPGESAAAWRIVGNHSGVVVIDSDDPGNQVLELTASGAADHLHNHAETTFVGNTPVTNGVEYEISYRAKWLAGLSQLNSRCYVSRVAATHQLDVPQDNGTPGFQNSRFQANLGPTYTGFRHDPLLPEALENVTVSVHAADPDTVAMMTLWWSIAGGTWQSNSMVPGPAGQYSGSIPGQSSATVVQFYVEGVDDQGGVSTYPATGKDSRALFEVQDGQGTTKPIDTLRIVMTATDAADLFEPTQLMSNAHRGATVIHNNREVFYDVGVRVKGSLFGRTGHDGVNRGSYRIRFHSDQKFRGVHESIALDASGRSSFFFGYGQDEILTAHLMNHAGGIASQYHDLGYMIAPNTSHTRPVIMMLARYSDVYLQETFGNDSDGTLFELEIIQYMTHTVNANPQSLKNPTYNPSWLGTDFGNMGDSNGKEDFRWNFQIKNKRARDNYDNIMSTAKAFDLVGTALDEALESVIDVDQWMRMYAMHSLAGQLDAYGIDAAQHNIWLYDHPGTGKIMVLPWDMDFSFYRAINAPLHNNANHPSWNIRKIIHRPSNLRLFYGHLQDMIQTTYNATYANAWFTRFGELADQNYLRHVTYIEDRANYVSDQLESLAPQVPFTVTASSPLDVGAQSTVTLEGTGWINVREIRLGGGTQPLEIDWRVDTDSAYADTWELTIPVATGTNSYTLEAYDYQGLLIGTSSIDVSSSMPNPVADALRIVELNYHPAPPTVDELAVMPSLVDDDFEFIEVQNIGTQTLNLLGTTFTDGVDFTFASVELAAGQRGVVVQNRLAFELRYGNSLNVIGEFVSGRLSNRGENLDLVDGQGQTVLSFAYDDADPWPQRADGVGGTLELIDPSSTAVAEFGKYYHWRGSTELGGSPAAAGNGPLGVVINEVLANTDAEPESDSIELFNNTGSSIDISGWWLSDSAADWFKYQIPSGTTLNPGQFIVFDEDDFNPTPLAPGANDFALSGTRGDDVWLVDPDGGGPGVMWLVDDVHFGAVAKGESSGRTSDGTGRLAPMEHATLGAANAAVRVGPLLISEIHFNPASPNAAALLADPTITRNDLEFVEIHNPTTVAVDLTQWRIRGGIDYDFPTGTMLAAGEVLVVVAFDPDEVSNNARLSAFRAHYGIDASVSLVGGFQGQLNDSFERVQLQRPDAPPLGQPTLTPRLQEDEVIYDDLAPWPTSADGAGDTLHRTRTGGWGNNASSWTGGQPGPGEVDLPGDTNLDGDVDTQDLTTAIINFTSAGGVGKTWAQGDNDGDGDVDTSDLTTAIIRFTGARANGIAGSVFLVAENIGKEGFLGDVSVGPAGRLTVEGQAFSDGDRRSSDHGNQASSADPWTPVPRMGRGSTKTLASLWSTDKVFSEIELLEWSSK